MGGTAHEFRRVIPKLTDEMALVIKIRSLQVRCEPFDGLTTVEQRRAIVQKSLDGIGDVTFTVKDGKRVTVREQFTRVYDSE